MPAITADTLTLPRLREPGLETSRTHRHIAHHRSRAATRARAFPVVRAFAGVRTADLDPFIHMDQMGEVDYEPGEPRGTSWHPHRGFETVTYMIDGRFQHQDSTGGGGLIENGATQWMTAGSGILHIETPPAEARRVRRPVPRHPAVGQPARPPTSSSPPSYQNLEAAGPDAGRLAPTAVHWSA